ncbi:class I SAM-dependent methyltransferase [Oceanicaulis sp. LC35]|uniref:class I SAM-dependent methyltransferase n=1 Tax=Oceanicaulis sp. LC35 TaxID=3349635 RepID=UPI003F83A72A
MQRLTALLFTVSACAVLAACGAPTADEEQDASAPAADMSADDSASMDEGLDGAQDMMDEAEGAEAGSLSWALEGDWRGDDAQARDAYRHPQETLEFFGIDPSGRVMEIWPGGGWYTDVLAPWINANGGEYIAVWSDIAPDNERALAFRQSFEDKFGDEPFGDVTMATFDSETGPIAEPGSVDAIVTFRNTHSWMSRGIAEKAFSDFYDALAPGGVLGLVQHRLPADRVQDPRASTGYVQQDLVVSMAEEAGFELVEASEINANPADTADHPFGVWTLPPVSRTSDFGEPADPNFDRAPYDAIGESDRMTLLFRKPAGE